jgi:hypothetical protein
MSSATFFEAINGAHRGSAGKGGLMEWARILAYITGTVDQELLLRNEYLVAENRILKAQLNGRLTAPVRVGSPSSTEQ